MIGDYSVLEKSMNGVKTLSDGISIISDGVATHENVIYTEYIKSEDEKTEILNDTINTENINAENIFGSTINSSDITSNTLNCNYLYVNDIANPLQDVMEVNGFTKKLIMYSPSEFRDTVNVINKNVSQTQGGTIQQTGTNFNILKDTKINGFIEVGSNIVQTGGSSTLKDVTCDNITMNTNKGITQSGTSSSNTFGSTTITNLTITGSVIFPSEVEIPGTTTTDDIIMNGDSVITQDITVTTTKFNKFRYTKTLDLDVDGNITQTKANATATLKNTTIQGSTTLQGDIEQTAGFTKLNTIECNNITLRENNNLNLSGTGKINQIGTGENTMNAITLNNNQNITFNGSGIISQPLNGTNIFSHFRGAGFGIIAGRNNTTFSHTQNIQNNNGLQFQYNRDNSSFYSYLLNNRVGSGGGFRFQRYNGGVYVDEPLVIDDNITMNKNLNIVGSSISASSATLGIISQDELNCLDNCNLNIITKFNTLDSQIASLQTTTGGVSTATTGISYTSGTDTTTIDNNLLIPSGKSLTLGTTNVNSFITDTNTFITAATNTLQGIVYTSGNDTTTINNNVSITGNLLVQGLDVKAEIDALETSFTTGTLTSTSLTTGTLNVTNQINMTNPTRSSRNINGIGFLRFCDYASNSDNIRLTMGQDGIHTYFYNLANNGQYQFLGINANGTNNTKRLIVSPDSHDNRYNSTTELNDVVVAGVGAGINDTTLNLVSNSTTANGVRIEPTRTTMTGGTNNIVTDASGISITGNNVIINDYNYNLETIKVTNVKFCNSDYSITAGTTTASNSNVLAYTFQPNTRFNKQLIVSVPISIQRNFRVNNDVIQWATVNESVRASVSVYKNGVLHTTFNSNTLNNVVSLFTDQPSSYTYTYTYLCGNFTISFTPDYNPTGTDTYTFYFTYNGSFTWETDTLLGFINVDSTITVNTTINNFTTNGTVRTAPILPELQTFNHATQYVTPATSNTTFTQVNQPLVTTDFISNTSTMTSVISNSVSAVNITSSSLISTNVTANTITANQITGINQPLHAWANIPCFYIDNSIANNFLLQEFTKPIYCSYKALGSNDDAFVVYPGYILVVYRYAYYNILSGQRPWSGGDDVSSQTRTIDNSSGTSPIFIKSVDLYGFANQVQSCKVYYKSGSSEMSMPFYSYDS